jgi:hypothetical protein
MKSLRPHCKPKLITICGMASCNVTFNVGKSRCPRVLLQAFFFNPFGTGMVMENWASYSNILYVVHVGSS